MPSPNSPLAKGQFYPPTIVADVTEDMLIAQEEIFGPIMCIMRVKGNSDREAVRMANNSLFGLSSCAFSKDQSRAAAICSQLQAGMTSVNDLEGTTYLSQSLPFGGCKESGFGQFAGPEGLRGLCQIKSVVENRISWLAPSIPPPLMYPSSGYGPPFVMGLLRMLYGYGIRQRLAGIVDLIKASLGRRPPNA